MYLVYLSLVLELSNSSTAHLKQNIYLASVLYFFHFLFAADDVDGMIMKKALRFQIFYFI